MTHTSSITIDGTKFIIERAKDFADDGRMIDGSGYFLNIETPETIHNGPWFETEDEAVSEAWKVSGYKWMGGAAA